MVLWFDLGYTPVEVFGVANQSRDRKDFAALTGNGTEAQGGGRAALWQPAWPEHSGLAGSTPGNWPGWAKVVVSVALGLHIAAVVAGAWGVPPSSELQRAFADLFIPYFDLADFGYSYRFYTEPPPTPVATFTLHFGEIRSDEVVRLPQRHVAGPRLRHQRQLALANAVYQDVLETRQRGGHSDDSSLARAYAHHLCRAWPGCQSVTVRLQQHLIPDPEAVLRATSAGGAAAFDLFDDSLFSAAEWIGEFACDDF